MIQALPTANVNLSIPSAGVTSTGATSRLASRYVAPTKTIATYAGGGGAPEAVTASDLAPPSVQTYAVQTTAPGMSTTTKLAIFGGIVLAVGAAIVVATRR
jgi:hypothetical protein